jgi:hypothetical protein
MSAMHTRTANPECKFAKRSLEYPISIKYPRDRNSRAYSTGRFGKCIYDKNKKLWDAGKHD